jgi:electron transfer flavoprotein alpha/beta subunit
MGQQAPNVSLAMALRDLIEMGLAMSPEEAAIHIERRRAFQSAQRFVYRTLAATFSTIQHDLENTAVLLGEQTDGD